MPIPSRAIWLPVLFLVLAAAAAIAARLSPPAFAVLGALLLVLLGYASYRAPRLMLVVAATTPLVDRYIYALLVPPRFATVTSFFSESLLLVVGLVILFRGVQTRRLGPALRHPATPIVVLFGLVGIISALVNHVPPVVAAGGLLFTVDAIVLFFLPRVVGFDAVQGRVAISVLVGVAIIAAVLAVGQVILAPNILGLATSFGRFGEGQRVGAFLEGSPNMLGALLATALPFPLFAIAPTTARRPRLALIGVVFVLSLALLYTFSRGAWLGLAVAGLVMGLWLDRRAVLVLVAMAALVYGLGHVLPRNLLLTPQEQELAAPAEGGFEFDLGEATFGRVDAISEGSDLRVLFINNAAPIIADHPIVGAGPGRYGGAIAARFGSPLYDEYRAGSVPLHRTVDNYWLHLTVEFGILGVLMMLGLIGVIVTELALAARRSAGMARAILAGAAAAAIVLTVDSLAEMLLEGNTMSFPLWFVLGVGSAIALTQRTVAQKVSR
jgi:O-antigen ligase